MTKGSRQYWEHVYQGRKVNEVSWYQEYPELSLQLIDASGIGSADAILDVGGGASVLVDHLLLQGFSRVAVLDISALALECARKRLSDQADRVEWIEADVTNFEPPHPFALWHDRAVFHFLTEAGDRQRYIEVLKKALDGGGFLILATFSLDGPQMCSGLPVERYDVDKMQATLGPAFRLLEYRPELHTTPSGGEQRFIYALFRYQP